MLTASARSDRLAGTSRRERAAASQVRVPSPQQLGYSGMVLDRLAEHARTVLGFEQAWILVSPPGRGRPPAAVAGAGTDPDLIGRRVATPAGAPGFGSVASATVLVGAEERGTLCLGGADGERKLERRERDLLDEVATLVGGLLGHHAAPSAQPRRLRAGDSRSRQGACGGRRRHLQALARGRRNGARGGDPAWPRRSRDRGGGAGRARARRGQAAGARERAAQAGSARPAGARVDAPPSTSGARRWWRACLASRRWR